MSQPHRFERGQAILLVTLSLVALCGVMGLATDLGLDYLAKRRMQSAADAAALSAIRAAFASAGANPVACGGSIVCQAPTNCPSAVPSVPVTDLDSACIYAQQQGFTEGGHNGRQHVVVAADITSPFVTATGPVAARYWVTVVVTESTPQLFSAVLGNTMATISSRATAAIVETVVDGALILLNRQNDAAAIGSNGGDVYGLDMLVQANDNKGAYAVSVHGILMASNCNGLSSGKGNCDSGNGATYAGTNAGGGTVSSPTTSIREGGGVSLRGSSQWIQPPQNSAAGEPFADPLGGRGQPPAPTGLADVPVLNGVIDGTQTPVLYPGNYYATAIPKGCKSDCVAVATGAPISITGSVRFAACAACAPGDGFGNYVIYGGITAGSSGANLTFDPGRYFLAGATAQGGNPGKLIDTSTNMNIQDNSSGPQTTDAGELFVLTDPNYRGLQNPAAIASIQPQLQFGTVNFQTGNNGTSISLHGLNKNNALIKGTTLEKFAPVVLWQDQANSRVKYTPNGDIDTSCGSLDSPCTTSLSNPASPEFDMQASPSVNLYGTVYQPRGAWASITAGGGYTGPLQLITGAIVIHANANVNMTGPTNPITYVGTALIE